MTDGQIPIEAVLKEMRDMAGMKDQEIAILRANVAQLSSALQAVVDATEAANS